MSWCDLIFVIYICDLDIIRAAVHEEHTCCGNGELFVRLYIGLLIVYKYLFNG